MRPVPVGGAAAALLLLLTWLLLRGIDVEQLPFDQALTALDRVELGESAMQRDVLSARAGLLRDYDPLVQDVQMLEDAVQRLHGSLADEAPVDQLAAWLAGEEPLLEEFKSDNALLQNSLAQFGQLSGRLAEPGSDGRPAVPGAGALASAMLRLALDTSPEAAREVEGRLDVLAAHIAQNGEHGLAPSVAEPAAAMLAHGRLLRDVLPAEDRTLRALLSSPSEPRREAVRAAVLAGRDAAKRVAWDYRILLYATAVLLLGCLIKLAQMLRSRALALRRRAAFEHMLAAVSTRLIRAEPAEIGSLVEGALARIAEHVGADRAYLLLAGSVKQEFLRASEGVGFPPDWPARIWSLAVRLRPSEDGVLRFSRRDPPPAGGVGNELTAAGLHGWIAALRTGADGEATALLGCDVVRPGQPVAETSDLGPLRLALDALANVVERAELEQERARLEAQRQQSHRMEALGAFASGIAHNFNNILGAILGYAEMAKERATLGGRLPTANLAEIRRAGERARDLVEQILAFGRGGSAVRRHLRVSALVAEAAALLRAALPRGVRLVVGEVPEASIVSGDVAQLQQVILNLGVNAAQAMEAGGTVEISVEERVTAETRGLAAGEITPGRYVAIIVADTGCGMDEVTRGRIFEPFFTTREAGHGLGLATVREVVLGHGGAIEVQSAPGVGTRFEIWLPQAGAADAAAAGAMPENLTLGRGETLLLVQGTADRLHDDEELLAALGYEPVGFAELGRALDAVRADPGRFDAAVVCGAGSASTAIGLAAALRRDAPGLPVILGTNPAEGSGAGAVAASGVVEVVRWPLDSTELAAALRRALKFADSERGSALQS
ncbi:MAG TPA: two-component system VirA-like sensor kinase [Crenalkalicoccus sp.]|nr:two-component system VirA-like sensor kinase [Crenalkalicoccus sp.]